MKTNNALNTDIIGKSYGGWDRFCREFIQWGILGLIVFSPLPAASVNEWSILVIQLTVVLMTVLYISMRKKPEINPALARMLHKMRWMVIGFFAYLIFQIIPMPSAFVRFISPKTAAYHSQFALNGARKTTMTLSLVPGHTLESGLEI